MAGDCASAQGLSRERPQSHLVTLVQCSGKTPAQTLPGALP